MVDKLKNNNIILEEIFVKQFLKMLFLHSKTFVEWNFDKTPISTSMKVESMFSLD